MSTRKLWDFFECFHHNELTTTSERATQPAWIRTPLLPHQQTSVHAALQLEAAKTGVSVDPLPGETKGGTFFANYGILGDRVGAGKSLIALAILKYPPPTAHSVEYSWRPNTHYDTAVGLLQQRAAPDELRPVGAALFLIPHALVGQWEEYVKNDTSLRCAFIKRRRDAAEDFVGHLDEYDAVFVSATMWREFERIPDIDTVLWSRMFIDEADSIMYSASSTDLKARFIWLISASWMNLVFSAGAYLNIEQSLRPPEGTNAHTVKLINRYISNHYMTIGGIRSSVIRRLCGNVGISGYSVGVLNPVIFQSTRLLIRNSEDFVRQSFEIPDIQHIYHLCLAPPNVQILRAVVPDNVMERLHAGDAEGVLEVLGMEARTADQIVTAVSDSVQKELDQVRRTYEFKKTIEYASASAKEKALAAYEERIARLASRIQAIQDRLSQVGQQTCPICYEEVERVPALTPCCRNIFCFACICEVLRRTPVCPLCRETIPSVQSLLIVGDGSSPRERPAAPQLHSKQETLRRFLQETPNAKVLLFSGYDATFHGLNAMLETEGVPHATLAGSQARISKLLAKFAEGKYRVLFLNARNMGAGLNIASATHVILYHRMPVETKNQIIGRAVRMGRTEPLTVLHFLHGNEMISGEAQEEGLTTAARIEHVD